MDGGGAGAGDEVNHLLRSGSFLGGGAGKSTAAPDDEPAGKLTLVAEPMAEAPDQLDRSRSGSSVDGLDAVVCFRVGEWHAQRDGPFEGGRGPITQHDRCRLILECNKHK